MNDPRMGDSIRRLPNEFQREKDCSGTGLRREEAKQFQFDTEVSSAVFGNKSLSGMEKCLQVTLLTDAALAQNVRNALSHLGTIPSPFNPPRTPQEECALLMIEVFKRFLKRSEKT